MYFGNPNFNNYFEKYSSNLKITGNLIKYKFKLKKKINNNTINNKNKKN